MDYPSTHLSSEEKLYRAIGDRIRQQRISHKLTQEQVAEKLRLTRTSITNIESGRQKMLVHTLLSFADIFDVDAADLLTISPSCAVQVSSDIPQAARSWIEGLTTSSR